VRGMFDADAEDEPGSPVGALGDNFPACLFDECAGIDCGLELGFNELAAAPPDAGNVVLGRGSLRDWETSCASSINIRSRRPSSSGLR
jgi:hypothetical protein